MNIEETNNKINNLSSTILSSGKDVAKDIAGFALIEGEVAADRVGTIANNTISKIGETTNEIIKNLTNNIVDGLIRYNVSIKNSQQRLTPMNQYPPINSYPMNQRGGSSQSEFMKYVYTEKPIWFTKKDMIWN